MQAQNLSRYASVLCVVAALLAGCGGSQPSMDAMPQTLAISPGPPRILRNVQAPSATYQVLYSFGGGSDGTYPTASLIDVNGMLYGTTPSGGPYTWGTFFSISTTGAEQVLHYFGGGSDGASPEADLIEVNGTLYGTTAYGGTYGYGTVFSITTSGTEQILHSFGSGSDGSVPWAALIDVKGTLYGTTVGGGTNGDGTVFRVSTTGKERVLHSFGSGSDGKQPYGAGLIDVKGTLYGTTEYGGDLSCDQSGCGTVYSISTTGNEQVLHNFGSGSDGYWPIASLIDVKGTLYGPAYYGGAYDHGAVFSISTSGAEQVLHSFGRSSGGGRYPYASLIDVKGRLYGTTLGGGAYNEFTGGTVIRLSPGGGGHVLHSFGSGTDGYWPNANLVNVNGTLYGTTKGGGADGYGTVFALRP